MCFGSSQLTTCTEFSNETLLIDRANSSAAASTTPGIATSGQSGKLRLFDILEPSGDKKIETLDLTIIVDNSVVEIWANDRFVLSTWVWYVLWEALNQERILANSSQVVVQLLEEARLHCGGLGGDQVWQCYSVRGTCGRLARALMKSEMNR